MKLKNSLLLAAALLATSLSATATTINFATLANTTYGESAWTTLSIDGVNITGSWVGGEGDAYAYLDAGTGGLGVCHTGLTGYKDVDTMYANNGDNLCLDSGDDNVTGTSTELYELLSFVFAQNVVIDSVSFNNYHDDDGSLDGDSIRVGGNPILFSASGTVSTSPGSWSASTPFEISWIDEEFYVESITFHTAEVPEPASLALLGLGLVGFAVSRRAKRKSS